MVVRCRCLLGVVVLCCVLRFLVSLTLFFLCLLFVGGCAMFIVVCWN